MEPPVENFTNEEQSEKQTSQSFLDFQKIIHSCSPGQYQSILKVLNTLTIDIVSKKRYNESFYNHFQDPIKAFASFLCSKEISPYDMPGSEKFSKKQYVDKIDKLTRFKDIITKSETDWFALKSLNNLDPVLIDNSWWDEVGQKISDDMWRNIFK